MSYFGHFSLPNRPTITPLSLESIGLELRSAVGGAPASAAWPSANRAIFIPFWTRQSIVVTKLFTVNGATAGNNLDIGIYDYTGTLIVSSGSTAQSGTSTLQVFDITDTPIGPGKFYLALAQNGNTGRHFRWNASIMDAQHCGIYTQESAFALPATATFATPASGYIPAFGLATATTV